MDEPLSNLDAKLRVQMRSEIARIQNDLGVTTIYVTHDQTEAMTMGDRVAVIQQGMLQQVDTPQTLYERPVNLFVAGFIGSPAMNLLQARLVRSNGSLDVELGPNHLPVPADVLAARPALAAYEDREIVLGIRPEDMEDAELVSDAPAERRISSVVELKEALGSDVVIHFNLAAHGGTAPVIARLNPRTRCQKKERVELVVDTRRLHFFDPDEGTSLEEAR
jgi:multiple sugar transport system ATP-binding protein